MSNRFPMPWAALLAAGLLMGGLIATPVFVSAQGSAFAQRFDEVLSQHGVVAEGSPSSTLRNRQPSGSSATQAKTPGNPSTKKHRTTGRRSPRR